MSIYSLDPLFWLLFLYFNCFLEQNLKNSKKNFFGIEPKVKFSGELEWDNERFNELTLLIVNSGIVPNYSNP